MLWTCLCGADHQSQLSMGDVCDACGERVVAAECVDYVIGYSIVSETIPSDATCPPAETDMHRSRKD